MSRLDMLPELSGPDLTDRGRINPQFSSQCRVGFRTRSDHQDILFRELGVPIPLSSGMTVPLNTLLDILLLGSQAQVVGMNTDGAVARVEDVHSASDWTVVDSVGHNVSAVLGATESYHPVSSALEGSSSPVPTPSSGRGSGHVVLEGLSLGEPPRLPGRSSSEGVAITEEPSGVRRAVPPTADRLIAGLNRADSHDRSVTHNEG